MSVKSVSPPPPPPPLNSLCLWVVVPTVLTKDSTNLPNQASQVSQAAGFVRLIRQLAVRLPLEGAGLLTNQAEAWVCLP